jgi:flagellar basal-body rod modification protein FlgD
MHVPQTKETASAMGFYSPEETPVSKLPQQTLGQADFLKLLVAQLSSQDPLNPVKDTDFLGQMAQFSTLQQTQAMQKDIASLQASQAAMQAQSLLGRTVQVQSAHETPVTGVVSAIGMEAGKPSVIVNGQAYDLGEVLMVSLAQPQS